MLNSGKVSGNYYIRTLALDVGSVSEENAWIPPYAAFEVLMPINLSSFSVHIRLSGAEQIEIMITNAIGIFDNSPLFRKTNFPEELDATFIEEKQRIFSGTEIRQESLNIFGFFQAF